MDEPTTTPLPHDKDADCPADAKTSGSLVGARRMLFEKQMAIGQAKDCTSARIPQLPQSSQLLDDRVAVRVIADAGLGDVNGRRSPVPSARVSRVSIRTLPLNDRAKGERSSPSSDSESRSPSPQPRPPSPSLLDDPAFAKRISYHHAVFKSPELILPPRTAATTSNSSSSSCSPKQEEVSDFEEKSIAESPQQEKEDGQRKIENQVSDVRPASTTSSRPQSVVIISEDLSSAREDSDRSSSLSSSRNIRESVVVAAAASKANNDGDENADDNTVKRKVRTPDLDYPQALNPFEEEDEKQQVGKKGTTLTVSDEEKKEDKRISSYNPFGSDSEEEEEEEDTQNKKTNTSTNPFWSGSEEEEEEEKKKKKQPERNDQKSEKGSLNKMPVPLPRSMKKPAISVSPQASPRRSLASSPAPSCRKLSGDSVELNLRSGSSSTQSTIRKKKPAPPPPPVAIAVHSQVAAERPSERRFMQNGQKLVVDEDEEVPKQTWPQSADRRSIGGSPWKHKKGPAPARPTPQRRPVKEMPLEDIKTEIGDIEIREQELERQGVQLEQMIREKTEAESAESPAVEEMVLQLFELVNEKNELFRRRSELINMRKMHQLEEEHAELEYQIRCLMLKPASNKTDNDKEKEEELIKKLLEVVERRNEIIEAMEKDRQRETAEDQSVTTQLENCGSAATKSADKKKKLKKLKKEKPSKKEQQQQQQQHCSGVKEEHTPGQLIKQKFMTMTLRHSTKKLHSKVPN